MKAFHLTTAAALGLGILLASPCGAQSGSAIHWGKDVQRAQLNNFSSSNGAPSLSRTSGKKMSNCNLFKNGVPQCRNGGTKWPKRKSTISSRPYSVSSRDTQSGDVVRQVSGWSGGGDNTRADPLSELSASREHQIMEETLIRSMSQIPETEEGSSVSDQSSISETEEGISVSEKYQSSIPENKEHSLIHDMSQLAILETEEHSQLAIPKIEDDGLTRHMSRLAIPETEEDGLIGDMSQCSISGKQKERPVSEMSQSSISAFRLNRQKSSERPVLVRPAKLCSLRSSSYGKPKKTKRLGSAEHPAPTFQFRRPVGIPKRAAKIPRIVEMTEGHSEEETALPEMVPLRARPARWPGTPSGDEQWTSQLAVTS